MPQDLIDARFFSDNEIRKLVDEINGEFARLNIESPFKDIDVSNGKELSKETKAILNDAKELQKVIAQISVAGASVRDNLTDERAIIEVQRKTETAIKQVKLLAESYKDVQKEVENILNTDHVVGFSVQGEDGQSIGEMGEQVGREFREGLESELNAYRGRDILNQTIFNGIDDAFSKYGADFDDIISKNLGNSKFDFHDLVMRALYSNILDSIGAGQGVATYERLNKDSINYSTKRDRVYIPDEVLDDAINKGTLRKGGYFRNKGAMTASDTVMPMMGENIIEGQGFLEQMERIATSYARLDEIATLLNSVLGEGEVVIHNPFRNWDAGEGIGAYSNNVDLMSYLFEKGGYTELIDELKPLRANLIRAIQTAYKDPNNHSGITKITHQDVEDLIDELSGKNNDNPIYNARTGLRYVNKAINKGHFNSLIDENGNVTGDYTDRERFGMRTGSLGNPNTRINNRPVMGLTDIPNISDLEGVDPNKYGEEMVDIIGKWFYRVAPQYSDAISRWITIWGNRLPDPDIEKKDTIGELEEVTYDKMSDVSVKGGSSFVPVGQKYYRGEEFLDSYNILPEFFSIGQIMPREVYEQFMGGDYEYGESFAKLGEPYDPTKPSEVIDGTTLTAEELQSILGDGVVIKDVSSSTKEIIKSGLADDFFGSFHDDGSNGEGISEEDFWKQQWESFQKIADIFKIPQIVNLLQKINERIYVFGTSTARALSSIKESVDNVDVKFEIPKDATFQVFNEGARPSFNIPNPYFDENGENIFLKMGRDGFGVVNGNEQQNKKLKKYRQSYNNSAEWEDYNERVDKLTKLSKSDNPEYRAFAEYALSEAKSMRDKGFNDRVRNQDLFMGLFGGKLPNMENFSFEDYGEFAEKYDYFMNTWNVVSHYTYEQLGEEIAKVNKQIAELESTGPSGDKGGMNNLEIDNKLKELNARKNDLLSNYNKFLLDEDELIYLEMMVKVYGSLLRGRAPYGKYKKRLESFLTLVNKGEFEASKQMSARIAEMEIGLKSIGADVSDIISKVLEKTNADLDGYRKELKSAKSGSAKKTLEKQIKALEEFKTHLENLIPDEGILPGYVTEYPNVFNPSALNSAEMYSAMETFSHEGGKEGIANHKFGDLNLFNERFSFLASRFVQLREQLNQTRYMATQIGAPKEVVESYNKTVEKLKKVHDLMFEMTLYNSEYSNSFKAIVKGYGDWSLSVDSLIAKHKELESTSKITMQSLTQSNQKALSDLFGGSIKWDNTGNAIANVGKESSQATSNFTKFTNNFDRATRAITGAGGALTWFFSIVGSGQALNDMVTASSLRQTNQIMLSARRGTEEATKLYDKIQMLVVKLPGNDTFLTNILTMLGTMDKSLSGADLEYMGGVIADYYMGAQAKGQFNNETERELRNYLMTGQTRNLTNSIIASEIESLKGLNSVKERTIALEKALQKTGMDSIAHYDSYTNTFEEFKGRFQKSFADWGDVWLGFLQLGMKTYNTLDSLTNSFLSQATIAVGVIVMGFIGLIGVLGTVVGMLGQVVGGLEQIQKFMNAPFSKDDDPYTLAIKKFIYWTLAKVKAIDEDTYATSINSISEEVNAGATLDNVKAKIMSSWSSLQEGLSKIWNTVAIYDEATANVIESETEVANTIVKQLNNMETTYSSLSELAHAKSRIMSAVATDAESASEVVNAESKNLNVGATLRGIWTRIVEIATKVGVIISTTGEALAVQYEAYVKGEASFATFALASGNIVLTGTIEALKIALGPVGAIFEIIGDAMWLVLLLLPVLIGGIWGVGEAFGVWGTIGSALGKVWDAVAGFVGAIVGGLGRIWDAFVNNEKIQYAMYIINGFFENLMAFFDMSFLGGIWELLFGTGTGEEFDILSEIINVLGAIGEFIWEISSMDEIIEVLRSVGALMGWVMRQWNAFVDSTEYQELIDGFREIRVAFGEIWTEIAPVFDELGKAWAELWGDEKGAEKLKEDGNELLELFKAIAHFIRDYVVPFIKLLVPLIKATLMPLVTVVKFITWIIEGVKWISDHFGMQNDKVPTNIANKDGGYNSIIEKQYQYDYAKGKDLAKRYINNNNGNSTVINNNFGEGSVQTNAHNMTQKEVRHLFTSAFGYNKANGVKGVLR